MDSLVRFFRKLWIFVRREKFNSELEEEMAFHREHAEKELQAEGLPPKRHNMPQGNNLAAHALKRAKPRHGRLPL